MRLGTLSKFNKKKELWISPKHPLYLESPEFKMYYLSTILMHTCLNKTTNSLSNFELERLLTRGFGFSGKEIVQIINLSKNVESIVDTTLTNLTTSKYKYLFLLDLINVSMIHYQISIEEQKSIDLFAKLLDIDLVTKNSLIQFISFCYQGNFDDCCKIFSQLSEHEPALRMTDVTYYMKNFDYTDVIDSSLFTKNMTYFFRSKCKIANRLTITKGKTLHISNAILYSHDTIILDGGSLIIENSSVSLNFLSKEAMDKHTSFITAKNGASIILKNVTIDIYQKGGFILQNSGTLTMENCSIFRTCYSPAISFQGDTIHIENSRFYDCFCNKNGGALYLAHGTGQINNSIFEKCQAQNGGAIFSNSSMLLTNNTFMNCKSIEHGSGIFYNGEIGSNVEKCEFQDCLPKNEEILQVLEGDKPFIINKEYHLKYSTLIHRPIIVKELGLLKITDATLFMSFPITCQGILTMKHAKVIEDNINETSLFFMNTTRTCHVSSCEFDGNLNCGIFYAPRTRLHIQQCIFKNTKNARAIYDSFSSTIRDSIFSFCQDGALYCNSCQIIKSTFINCRSNTGAAIFMYGNRGNIENCSFIRCISDFSQKALDLSGRYHIINCTYEECKL